MRPKPSIIFFLCISALTFSSCLKELKVEDSAHDSSLVINSIFSPDSLWIIEISRTVSIFSDDDTSPFIDDATIRLEDLTSNTEITFECLGNGIHRSSSGYRPIEGHFYELFVNANGFEQAYAATFVPRVPEPLIETISEINVEGTQVFKIDISIENDPTEENFYVWEIMENSGTVSEKLKIFDTSEIGDINDVVVQSSPATFNPKVNGNYVFISDQDISGGSLATSLYAVPALVEGTSTTSTEPQPPNVDEVIFELKVRAVSRDLYMYMQSLEDYRNVEHQASSVLEPQSLYSNISNGEGVFGGFAQKIIKVTQ